MCLERSMDIEDRDYEPVKDREYFEGWKTLHKDDNGKLYTILCGAMKSLRYGHWINEEDYRGVCREKEIRFGDNSGSYPKGFHVCLTEKGARKWSGITLRVRFRGPLAWGYQGGEPCVVAKELFIPDPSKE